jgi:TM2 domain-containing membrane protein YozV
VAAAAPALPKAQPLLGPPDDAPVHHRTRGIAFLLAVFLGGMGAHLFYLGYHKRAVTYLMVSLAGGLLLFVGLVGLLLSVFGSVGGAYLAALLVGTILLSAVSLLTVVDAIRILTNDLKPREGEYYPQFFQTRAAPGPQPD